MKRPHKEEALRWFTQAKDEFEDADELRKRFYLALFHFQQAAEKALKAYLYLKVESSLVFLTHSIDDLSEMAIEIDSDFNEVKKAKKLDEYYIPTRYPNGEILKLTFKIIVLNYIYGFYKEGLTRGTRNTSSAEGDIPHCRPTAGWENYHDAHA
ncbi:MAG: HEPN domain-containing protein [Deltaproteobacteria bacterium]|nr:HEPN domain-containing protein [Deltaproteobacteria bacterium]